MLHCHPLHTSSVVARGKSRYPGPEYTDYRLPRMGQYTERGWGKRQGGEREGRRSIKEGRKRRQEMYMYMYASSPT